MLLALLAVLSLQDAVHDDMLIDKSTTFTRAVVRVVDSQADGLIRIRGDDIVVDFGGMTLIGSTPGDRPNEFRGFAVLVENSKRVTIKNLIAGGFKIGILARNVENLRIENCDLSENWRMKLFSTPEHENFVDWLRPHENDAAEWMRYGAAIYAVDCPRVHIAGNRGRNGQNGIVLSRCDDGRVFDNDFSFMSGWGLAMWRSSRNDVSNNRFDWCIRGYSNGVYRRGQDSAGILVFEQCCDNIFAYNSATHGGDGFFLYAGHETVERTGDGGSNRNILYRNDFSHAACNGIEATFSDQNKFIENIIEECDHGIWAGFSTNTLIQGNIISRCKNGVAIEHGRDTTIETNTFRENGVGVRLWWKPDSPFAKTPYGKKREVKSANYMIARNQFGGDSCALAIDDTTGTSVVTNTFDRIAVLAKIGGKSDVRIEGNNIDAERAEITVEGFSFGPNFSKRTPFGPQLSTAVEIGGPTSMPTIPKTAGTLTAFLPDGALRGRRFIFVDSWGPYDFKNVRIVPQRSSAWEEAAFTLVGPDAPFEVVDVSEGVVVTPPSGKMPATLTVKSADGKPREFSFRVKTPAAPEKVPAGGIILIADWKIDWFAVPEDSLENPAAWQAIREKPPIVSQNAASIDFDAGNGAPRAGVPADHFGMTAVCTIELEAGEFEFRTVADDGVRVWIDDVLVIDDWHRHPSTETTARTKITRGRHTLVVHYVETVGNSQLEFSIMPMR